MVLPGLACSSLGYGNSIKILLFYNVVYYYNYYSVLSVYHRGTCGLLAVSGWRSLIISLIDDIAIHIPKNG